MAPKPHHQTPASPTEVSTDSAGQQAFRDNARANIETMENRDESKSPQQIQIDVINGILDPASKLTNLTAEQKACLQLIQKQKASIEQSIHDKEPRGTDAIVGAMQIVAGVASFVPGPGTAIALAVNGAALIIDTGGAIFHGDSFQQIAKTAGAGAVRVGAGAVPGVALSTAVGLVGVGLVLPADDTADRNACHLAVKIAGQAIANCPVEETAAAPDKAPAATPPTNVASLPSRFH